MSEEGHWFNGKRLSELVGMSFENVRRMRSLGQFDPKMDGMRPLGVVPNGRNVLYEPRDAIALFLARTLHANGIELDMALFFTRVMENQFGYFRGYMKKPAGVQLCRSMALIRRSNAIRDTSNLRHGVLMNDDFMLFPLDHGLQPYEISEIGCTVVFLERLAKFIPAELVDMARRAQT